MPSATRVMSFLACRIRGFDAIMELLDRDPAGLTKLSRCTLTPLIQAVLDRQGTIDRMSPDGFTAFFNAPLDDSQHASHACECALAIMLALEKANRRLEHAIVRRRADGTGRYRYRRQHGSGHRRRFRHRPAAAFHGGGPREPARVRTRAVVRRLRNVDPRRRIRRARPPKANSRSSKSTRSDQDRRPRAASRACRHAGVARQSEIPCAQSLPRAHL